MPCRAALALALFVPVLSPAAAQTLPGYGRGATPEQQRAWAVLEVKLRDDIGRLAERNKISRATLMAIARAVGETSPNLDLGTIVQRVEAQAGDVVKLNALVGELRTQIATISDPAQRDPGIAMLARAQKAIDEGRLADADRELAGLQYLRLSQLDGSQASWRRAVIARADVARLAQEYDRAAEIAREARELQRQAFDQEQWLLAQHEADSYYQKGDRLGDNAALSRAITLYRDVVLPLAPRTTRSIEWGITHYKIGNAYRILSHRALAYERALELVNARKFLRNKIGKRLSLSWEIGCYNSVNCYDISDIVGTSIDHVRARELIAESISAYQLSLQEVTRERASSQWVAIQLALGSSLQRRAEIERGTAPLEEAVAAYRLALQEISLDRDSHIWVWTHRNLGHALLLIGKRENGTARLVESATALRLALQGSSRKAARLQWADILIELGTVSKLLGERESDTLRLKESLAAYQLALEEYTRTEEPRDWADIQHQLAETLFILGKREIDLKYLENSVSAYRLALEERTQDRTPFGSISTQVGLADAIYSLAIRNRDIRQLEEARIVAKNAQVMANGFWFQELSARSSSILKSIDEESISMWR